MEPPETLTNSLGSAPPSADACSIRYLHLTLRTVPPGISKGNNPPDPTRRRHLRCSGGATHTMMHERSSQIMAVTRSQDQTSAEYSDDLTYEGEEYDFTPSATDRSHTSLDEHQPGEREGWTNEGGVGGEVPAAKSDEGDGASAGGTGVPSRLNDEDARRVVRSGEGGSKHEPRRNENREGEDKSRGIIA
eukprot:1398179-Rhodomonas_salina.2